MPAGNAASTAADAEVGTGSASVGLKGLPRTPRLPAYLKANCPQKRFSREPNLGPLGVLFSPRRSFKLQNTSSPTGLWPREGCWAPCCGCLLRELRLQWVSAVGCRCRAVYFRYFFHRKKKKKSVSSKRENVANQQTDTGFSNPLVIGRSGICRTRFNCFFLCPAGGIYSL